MKNFLLVTSLIITLVSPVFTQPVTAPLADTWTVQTSNTTATLYAVSIVDQNIAWACGSTGKVIKTTNGGTTWTAYTLPVATEIAYVIKGLDANNCLVSTSPSTGTKIFRTTDGGTTWTETYNQTGGFIDGIWMFTATNGYAIGDPVSSNWTLIKTSDGGATWTSAATLAQVGTEAGWNNSLVFIGNTGYFGTNNTKVYKTTDAGNSWSPTSSVTLNSYILAFVTADVGMLGGTGAINVTTNGGTNWTAATSPITTNTLGLAALGTDNYIMVGSTNAYITTNNGTSWTTSYSGTSSLYHIELKGNVTSAFGYAVGASGKVVKFVRQPATPTLTLTAPNGGEVWAIGASKNITWTSANITNVAIKYSTDNGTNWMSVAASVPAATGTYAWTIPNTPSTQCKVRVSDASNDLLFDVSDAPFTISTQQIINAQMAMAEGWNMTSVPVVAANMTGSVLFSGANSQIFGYNNGYVTQTTLSNGVGYWVRYPAAANFTINGTAVAATTVPLVNGWNMVGVFHNNVPTANITTTPAGIINSFFFGFNNGYVQATTLESGKGYWVRTTQSGVMNVPGALLKDGQEGSTQYISQANNITISDAFGHSMILQVGRIANKEMSSYSLPPLPPEGVFDARFADNSCGKDISPAGETVLINSAEYPIMISASSEQFRIVDKATGGKICNVIIGPGQPAIITNNAVHAIEILPISTPTQYSLEQNFPNPFNPSTSIRFHLASKETVRLTVINQLGQTVALLVNEEKEAGIYQVPFNAEGFASGIYYAVLKTERYSSGVKMILMK